MIDWKDPKRTDVIRCYMVDPNNLDEDYGEIEDVQLGSSPITYGYYTDTRYSSQITFLRDNNYLERTWIRIVHEVPADGYTNELGTFVPVSPSTNYGGAGTMSLNLQSPLWAISNDFTTAAYTISKGTSLVKAFQNVCNTLHRAYVLNAPNDYLAGSAIVYEPGTSYLSILFDIANNSNNRVDLDGHGRITLDPAVSFQDKSAVMDLDADDPRSIIIANTLKMETESDEIPNRVIVIDESYSGYADLPDGSEYSAAQRGYVKAEKYSGSGITSNAQAKTLAQTLLNNYTKVTHWTMQTLYFPAKCGDTVYFIIDGQKHLCMIQNIDPINLQTMTMSITVREVG